MNFRSTSEELDPIRRVREHLSEALVSHVLRTGSAVQVADPAHDPRFGSDPTRLGAHPRTVMCLPFSLGKHKAALYVERLAGAEEFTREDLEVARLLANQAAAAIDGVNHYEWELRSVRRRIDPQFLHNSLSMIAQLVVSDTARAETALLMFSRLHRYLFEAPGERLVCLTDEVDICRDYLALEQYRLGERLAVDLEVQGPAHLAYVPALVLQGLTENSVRHGSARKMGTSRIRVLVTVDDAFVRLEVADDGPAWDPQGDLRESGLSDVVQRLSHFFLQRHGVRFTKEAGVAVEITFPRVRALEDQ